jgi:hypothetical protein
MVRWRSRSLLFNPRYRPAGAALKDRFCDIGFDV